MRNAFIIFSLLSVIPMLSFRTQKKRVLIIGDSISIGYFPYVKKALSAEAEIEHNPGNAQHTGTGLQMLNQWLGNQKWDVIHFNWGLWDLCYRNEQSTEQGNRDKVNGKITYSVEQYAVNLDSLVQRLKATGAKLIFATTTVVPANEAGRFQGDEKKYNNAALQVMRKYGVLIDDLNTVSYKIHKQYAAGNGNVHYTESGYEQLSETVIQSIKKIL